MLTGIAGLQHCLSSPVPEACIYFILTWHFLSEEFIQLEHLPIGTTS